MIRRSTPHRANPAAVDCGGSPNERGPRPSRLQGTSGRAAFAALLIAALTAWPLDTRAVPNRSEARGAHGPSDSAPARLPLIPYSVSIVAVGTAGPITIVLPEPAAEVVTSSLDAFSVDVSGSVVSISVVAIEPARHGADLFVTLGDVTYTLELLLDPKASARTFEAFEADNPRVGRPVSVTGAPARGDSSATSLMFVDGAALRLPPVITSIGRLTRIELPTSPVNILNLDPESFSVDVRGSDLYVGPSPDLARLKENERRGRLQVFMHGGAVLDFDLRVGPTGRHHRGVIVRVAPAPERQVLRRRTP